jgi:WD40 repeat protein
LCGTDDGFIHQCSTIYNEKYLESYIGHTGPVYKVHWSPFAENLFLSASADWTVRIWMTRYNQSCMIFSSSNSKVFFDAIWSPKSSTIFCCVSENAIEIWDLSKST